MATSLLGVRMKFQSIDGYGFTESHMLPGVTDITKVQALATPLMQARVNLLGAGVLLKSATAFDRANFRNFLPLVVPTPANNRGGGPIIYNKQFVTATTTLHGFTEDEGDYANASTQSVLAQKKCSTLYSGNYYIAGCPAFIFSITDAQPDDPDWTSAWTAYQQVLINGNYGMLVASKDPLAAPLNPIVAIASVAGVAVITTKNAHGLVAGDRCIVTGVKGTGGQPHGRLQVAPGANLTTNTFAVTNYNNATFVYLFGGNVRKLVPAIAAYTGVTLVSETKRNRGNSAFRKKGRTRRH